DVLARDGPLGVRHACRLLPGLQMEEPAVAQAGSHEARGVPLGSAEAERDPVALLEPLTGPSLRRPLGRVDDVRRTDGDLVEEEPSRFTLAGGGVADLLHDSLEADPAAGLDGGVAVDVGQLGTQRLVVIDVYPGPRLAVVEEDTGRPGLPGLLSDRVLAGVPGVGQLHPPPVHTGETSLHRASEGDAAGRLGVEAGLGEGRVGDASAEPASSRRRDRLDPTAAREVDPGEADVEARGVRAGTLGQHGHDRVERVSDLLFAVRSALDPRRGHRRTDRLAVSVPTIEPNRAETL